MRSRIRQLRDRAGKGRYALIAWLIGLPLPIILIAWLVGGCEF